MIRDAVYAGRWYPGDPDELDRLVSYGTEAGDKARLAVLPHAGLYYSHRGIAHFFARMEEGIQRIIILSPSHYVYLRPDHILTGRFEGFLTPYGTIKGEDLIGFDEGGEAAIQKEHAVEMVLPFIAKRPGVSVSMGLISQVSDPLPFAEALASQMDEHTAVIASSDFTHYGASFEHTPYGLAINKTTRGKVEVEDRQLATLLAQNRYKESLDFAQKRHSTVCGIAPSAIVSCLAGKLGLTGEVTDYYTSFELGGGDDSFVGYATVLWG